MVKHIDPNTEKEENEEKKILFSIKSFFVQTNKKMEKKSLL